MNIHLNAYIMHIQDICIQTFMHINLHTIQKIHNNILCILYIVCNCVCIYLYAFYMHLHLYISLHMK